MTRPVAATLPPGVHATGAVSPITCRLASDVVAARRWHAQSALGLFEQSRQLVGIVGIVGILVGEAVSDKFARLGVVGDVQFPSGARGSTVLLLLSLVAAEQIQTGAVDHEVQRAVQDDFGSTAGQAGAATAEGRVIGNGKGERAPRSPGRLEPNRTAGFRATMPW
ncbi:hypothetical protein [Marinivivus vitaminiproducens]|uniref:hypothetical protein n=1 Tax=Marinivivus vitaminiproducens TaxID=3035935 RepID=UPI00279B140A|nr:hypothetical protein P4R82_23645 [Geminicoccaceae bacterium SCSIO 64248]